MAARRLIVVMIVLLLASSVAAALVPIPESAREDSTQTTTAPPTRSAESVQRTLRTSVRRAQTIRVHAGDQLSLRVVGDVYDLVEIPALGQLEDLDPASPARFDLLLDQPGAYVVRLTQAGEVVGRIEVAQGGGDTGKPRKPRKPSESAQVTVG